MLRHLTVFATVVYLVSMSVPAAGQAARLRVAPEMQSAPVGEVVSVDIEWVDGDGWIGGSYAVHFDDSLLEYVGYEPGNIGDPQFSQPPDVSPGLLDLMSVASFSGIESGTAATLSFRMLGSGQALVNIVPYGDWGNGTDFLLRTPDDEDGAIGSDDIGVSRGSWPDFIGVPDIPLGQAAEFKVDLTSVGTAPLVVHNVTVPTDQDVFRLTADRCTGRVLRPGARCLVYITATAFEFGFNAFHNTDLDFVTSDVIDQGDNTRLALGNVRPVLEGTGLTFLEAPYTPPYARRTARITNVGDWPADIDEIVFDGNYRDNFFVVGDGCTGRVLAVGETCEALIEFRPRLFRRHTASYKVFYGNRALVKRTNIVGYPPMGLPYVEDSQVQDWTQPVGDATPREIRIYNRGSLPLTVTNGSLISRDGFLVTENCLDATLVSGEWCTISLRSAHAVPGDYRWTGWMHTDSLWRNPSFRVDLTVTD